MKEGLNELLTVKRLGIGDPLLERTFSTTNLIENLIGQARDLSRRVKRWKNGAMILRWTAAGVLEAESRFNRIKGHRGMPTLVAALRKHDRRLDGDASRGSAVVTAA